MENKEIKKVKRTFKVSAWLDLVVVILSVISIISVLITKETTVFGYVVKDLIIIMDSLTLAFVCGRVTVIPKNVDESNDGIQNI